MVFGIRAASGTSDASSSRRQRKIEEKYRWRKPRFFVPHQTPIPATQFLFSRSCYYLYVVYTYLSVSILCVSYRCCDTYALYIIKEAVIGYYIKMNTKHNRDVGNHTQKNVKIDKSYTLHTHTLQTTRETILIKFNHTVPFKSVECWLLLLFRRLVFEFATATV